MNYLATTGAFVSLALAVTVLSPNPAFATKPSDAGQANGNANKGTVKIDGKPFDDGRGNEPHVDCDIQVDFYNYDKGAPNAKVSFELQNPTKSGRTMTVSGNTSPVIGSDPAGQNDLDASVNYTFAFTGQPHPKQGYHVKMTVVTDRGVKHKVFWVKPCKTTATSGGQVLGSKKSDVKTASAPGELPGVIPSTGAGWFGLFSTALLSGATYGTVYIRQGRRSR